MTGHALRPAGIVPGLLTDTVWMLWGSGFTNCELAVCTLRADQRGLCLGIVPEVRVADPLALLFDQEAGLNPSAGAGVALFDLQRERLHQDGAVRKVPAGIRGDINL